MKKIILFILAIFLIAFSFVGCKKTEKVVSADDSLTKVLEKKVLIMGLDDSFPPLGFRDNSNKIVGYDIDLATEVCNRLGIELVLQPIDWSAKEQELNTGKIDCIWNGFTMTDERVASMCFTKPYLANSQVAIIRKDSGFKTLADLAGKTIGLQAGSSAAEAVDEMPDFKNSIKNIVEFKDNLTAFMDLEIRGIDAVVMDDVVGAYYITRDNKPFEILGETLKPEEYGIGFRKNDVALCTQVQTILEEMARDGKVAEISTKWFGRDISIIGK